MPWDWESFPEFLDSLDRTPKGVNILSYVGLSPLMIHVMGLDNARARSANDTEMAEMRRLLIEAMEAGAQRSLKGPMKSRPKDFKVFKEKIPLVQKRRMNWYGKPLHPGSGEE